MTDETDEPAPTAHPARWFGLSRSANRDASMVENSFTIFLLRLNPAPGLAEKIESLHLRVFSLTDWKS
jgi:hypothetical protein